MPLSSMMDNQHSSNGNAILWIRSIYLASAISIAFLSTSKVFREQFILYGARATSQKPPSKDGSERSSSDAPPKHGISALIDKAANIQVPHSWFSHFYIASIAASAFWAIQYALQGSVLNTLAANAGVSDKQSMPLSQVAVMWTLMTVQGVRRLYETMVFGKSSSSQMWIGHWALGILFYLLTSCAIWIEGPSAVESKLPSFTELKLPMPSFKTFVGLPLFLIASGIQHDCHGYLASLQKYSLPRHPAFGRLIAPHYLAECVIYLALSVVGAPPGVAFNRTMSCALIFVVANLGVTAQTSRQWYVRRFGEHSVEGKWNMIPVIF